MRVLVIIPTHCRLDFLDEAIRSVGAQTRPVDELVITGNVGPGVISDGWIGDRLNSAIENSDCDAFVMLSDDDTLAPDFLERTVAAMERERTDIVYTDCMVFGAMNREGYAVEWTRENIDRNTVPLVTSLCTRTAWERAGKYLPSSFFDWHFWWRCFYTGVSAYWLHEHLWNYRIHPGQESKSADLEACRQEVLARHDALRPLMMAKA